MGPALRPFAVRRDPWWDASGRTTRRRRRRRLLGWAALLVLGATVGLVAGEARAADASHATTHAASAYSIGTWSSVTRSAERSTR